MTVTIVGVDPGLVDTGIVAITLHPDSKGVRVRHQALHKAELPSITRAIDQFVKDDTYLYIEKYVDRGTVFTTHAPMRQLESDLKRAYPYAQFVDNTGSKKVVTRQMMELLNVWSFPTTNHMDLQAAARIALFGALKNPELNYILYKISNYYLGEKRK